MVANIFMIFYIRHLGPWPAVPDGTDMLLQNSGKV